MTDLRNAIRQYERAFPEESGIAGRFLELLEHPDAYLRTHLPGHITGSPFIVDETGTYTLLVHHAKLNKWLQPGGHADGDRHIVRVALREGEEETGVSQLTLAGNEIFDLDIHRIPSRKDFPEHEHFDVRFLVRTSRHHPITVSEESHDVRWIRLDELEKYNPEEALIRMRRKFVLFGFREATQQSKAN